MCGWQEMGTAPKTGEVVVGDFDGWPVMMAWMKNVQRKESRPERHGMFGLWTHYVDEVVGDETGWRVLMPGRGHGEYFLHGNWGPIEPRQWMRLSKASRE